MKKRLLLPILLATSIIAAPSVQAEENLSLRICEYIQANDKSRLRWFLKQYKLKLRKIYGDQKCDGDNVLIFAAKSNALEVGEYIIGKIPSKTVKAEIENLAKHSAHLAEAAKER